MSEAKFTPGPWQVKHEEYDPWEVIANIDGPDEGRFHWDSICDCDQDSKSRLDSEETKANARLIAAAPQMYEALTSVLSVIICLDVYDRYRITREQCTAALDKARGKP